MYVRQASSLGNAADVWPSWELHMAHMQSPRAGVLYKQSRHCTLHHARMYANRHAHVNPHRHLHAHEHLQTRTRKLPPLCVCACSSLRYSVSFFPMLLSGTSCVSSQVCAVCRKTTLEEGRRFKFCPVCQGVSYCSESCFAQHNLKHQAGRVDATIFRDFPQIFHRAECKF